MNSPNEDEVQNNKNKSIDEIKKKRKRKSVNLILDNLKSKENNNVISIHSFKGGVGKTTMSMNIADVLYDKNKNIVLIDFDPQYNLTDFLLSKYIKEHNFNDYIDKILKTNYKNINLKEINKDNDIYSILKKIRGW